MTNKEAKEKLYMEWQKFLEDNIDYAGISDAYKTAFKALEQEPCSDAISRQAVDELSKNLVHTTRDKADFLCNFWEGLQKLPPVTSQQKMGYVSIDDAMSVFDDFMCGEVDEDGTNTFLEMLIDKAEGSGKE